MVVVYGNTQPLMRYGLYEVSERVLGQAHALGCRTVVSLAGLRQEYVGERPRVFCVASDFETLDIAVSKGVSPLQGEVSGMAGLLVGLARQKDMRGLCLLAETLGIYPDPNAARAVLERLSAIYEFGIETAGLAETAKDVSETMQSLNP